MATSPIPLTVTISDPATATVQSVCNLGTAALNFLSTEKGQVLVGKWIEDSDAAEAWIAKQFGTIAQQTGGGFWTNIGSWFSNLFK